MPSLSHRRKPILHGFVLATALATSAAAYPLSLWNALDAYGFKEIEQKQAIEFLLEKAGVPDAEKLLKSEVKTPDELFANIIKFVEETQKHFTIRTGVQERWEVEATEWMKLKSDQQAILLALSTLGITKAVMPEFTDRDAISILGATYSRMKLRLDFAGNLYAEKKLPAKILVLLAGERYVTFDKNGISIDGSKEDLSTLAKKLNKDTLQLIETDLIRAAYEKSSLFNKLPVKVIDTPKRDLTRPTTKTTIIELIKWLKVNPEVKTITFVSNQPHIRYQEAVIATIFKEENIDIKFEIIGSEYILSEAADRSVYIKDLVSAFGTQIYGLTPSVIEKLELEPQDANLKEKFQQLYKDQPLVYGSLKFKSNL